MTRNHQIIGKNSIIRPPKSKYVREEERESSVVVEPPDVDESGVGLVGEHLDARHVLRRDEVAVVPAEHGYLHFGVNVKAKYPENPVVPPAMDKSYCDLVLQYMSCMPRAVR